MSDGVRQVKKEAASAAAKTIVHTRLPASFNISDRFHAQHDGRPVRLRALLFNPLAPYPSWERVKLALETWRARRTPPEFAYRAGRLI